MNCLRFLRIAGVLLLPGLLLSLTTPARAQSQSDINKVVRFMQADDFNYKTTTSNSVWTIHFAGKHLNDIKVVVAVGDGDDPAVIAFVTVTEKRRMPISTGFMRTLLEENHKLDRVKVAYDADGDLEVRIDAMLRITDAREFADVVNQVKNASDEIYGLIQDQLVD